MGPAGIVMGDPCREQTPQVVLCEGKHEVYTLSPQRAEKPLADGIRLRTGRWRFQHPEPEVVGALVELRGENAVPIMQQKAIGVVSRDRFTQLLQRPRRRRVRRDIGVQHAAGRMFHHDKHIKEAKGGRDDHAEVTRDDRLSMIADKGTPALRCRALAWPPVERLWQVSPHGTQRYLQAQLQPQFVGNALLPPGRVVTSHLADERLQLRRNGWSSRLGLPAPEQPESLAMPAKKSVWLHHGQRLTSVESTAQPDQSATSSVGSTAGFDMALLIAGKLLAQKEVFCCQPRRWTQTEPKEMDDIDQHGQQRTSEMPHMVKQAHASCHSQDVPLQRRSDP